MTQEQRKAIAHLHIDLWMGADHVVENPSDFGLVSMEEMFEFAEWVNDNRGNWQYYKKGWCNPGGSNGFYCTTFELFQIFKSKDNDKR